MAPRTKNADPAVLTADSKEQETTSQAPEVAKDPCAVEIRHSLVLAMLNGVGIPNEAHQRMIADAADLLTDRILKKG